VPLSDGPVEVTAYDDPVAAFLTAHDSGRLVALPTSGSTGAARRVLRTTRSWVASFAHASELTGTVSGSAVWIPGPRTGTMNLFAAVHAAWAGAQVVDDPIGATHGHLTPYALGGVLRERPEVLRGLTVVVAGDRLSPALHARASAAGARVCHYYGAAELSFVAWGRHAEDLQPFPGVEIDVRRGELWVRSAYCCVGYDGQPGPLREDGEGFRTVGDRGRLEDGRVLVDGRPGAVTTGGATVQVADVERVLRPETTGEVLVLGVPHPDLGRVLTAVLTAAADQPALRLAARDRLDPAARPRRWFAMPALPRTEAGKVDRDAVAEAVAAGRVRRLA
jgi:acyl-coenzyme A synthetase/AMP-(fatty) acid ligase